MGVPEEGGPRATEAQRWSGAPLTCSCSGPARRTPGSRRRREPWGCRAGTAGAAATRRAARRCRPGAPGAPRSTSSGGWRGPARTCSRSAGCGEGAKSPPRGGGCSSEGSGSFLGRTGAGWDPGEGGSAPGAGWGERRGQVRGPARGLRGNATEPGPEGVLPEPQRTIDTDGRHFSHFLPEQSAPKPPSPGQLAGSTPSPGRSGRSTSGAAQLTCLSPSLSLSRHRSAPPSGVLISRKRLTISPSHQDAPGTKF